MRKIIVFASAQRDLDQIWEYIAVDNRPAADRLVETIARTLNELADMPGVGHHRPEVPDPRYRFWSVQPYVIAYRFSSRSLTVVRIVHGARDFNRLFGKK